MGKDNPAEYLAKVEETYNTVYELDPSFSENKLTLVEFFGGLPEEVGGNREKAEKYAQQLENADVISAAKAKEILLSEDADFEKFWVEIVKDNPGNADAVQALGRIFLFNENIEEARKQYLKAMELDPSKNDLYIDLARYYMMMAMQNPSALDSIKPIIEEQFNNFLKSVPEPLKPMKAWVYATLSMISRHSGNMEEAEQYMERAKEMDPFFSPSYGKPSMVLFSPPDEVVHEQGYYLSPF
jgi:tetratricopeptide (TPR) repeat protein